MKVARLLSPLLLLLLFAVVALDAPPVQANSTVTSGEKSTKQVVASWWFGVEAPASATVFTCFTEADTTTPALFPWYSTVVATCSGRGVACWLQDTAAITIDANGVLTDSSAVGTNGADGRGPCFSLQANLPRAQRNGRSPFQTIGQVGRRSGACVDGSSNATGRPCDADADCTGADTCDLAADRFSWSAGAYLCVTSPAGTAITCDANIEAD